MLIGGDVNFDALREQINLLLSLHFPDVVVDTSTTLLSASLSILIRVHVADGLLDFNHRCEYPYNR